MKHDLAYPIHVADEAWGPELVREYREHRRKHGWLRDLAVLAYFGVVGTALLALFFAAGSLQ